MTELCEDSTALLDTFYDDVIVGVIGNTFGCEPPSNPLLCTYMFFIQGTEDPRYNDSVCYQRFCC